MRLPHLFAVVFGLRHRMTMRARVAAHATVEVSIVPAVLYSNIFAHASTSSPMHQVLLLLLPACCFMLHLVASLCDMTTGQMEVAICSRMVNTRRPQR